MSWVLCGAQKRRLVLGVIVLLLVDIIWVASSELTVVSTAQTDIRHMYVHRDNCNLTRSKFIYLPNEIQISE